MTRTIDENALHEAIRNNNRLVITSAIRPYNDDVGQSVAEIARNALRQGLHETTRSGARRNPDQKLDFDLEGTSHQLTDRISQLVFNEAERERFR